MRDAIVFFQQYESAIYFILAGGLIYYGFRFYLAWQELRGSLFGLEQVSAQRRLNQSALVMFIILVMGVAVFSIVTFALPVISVSIEAPDANGAALLSSTGADTTGTPVGAAVEQNLATATPLPTVAVDPELCIADSIMITFPKPNEEVSGVIEVKGVVNVEDFGFYMFEIARAEEELWLPVQAQRSLAPEESVLLEWDTSLFPPGSYVIQLVVTKSDGQEYSPCRIPIRIGTQ